MNIIKIYPSYSNILLIGLYPPPLGGVSVHIKRLTKILKKSGKKIYVFDTSQKQYFKGQNIIRLAIMLFTQKIDIVHLHLLNIEWFFVVFLIRCFKKYDIYITIHNTRLFSNLSKIKKKYYLKNIKKANLLIFVSKTILNNYKRNGVIFPKKVLVQNAFFPPDLEDEEVIIKSYSQKTMEFLNSHSPLIIANAYRIVFYKNKDLYGIDICIKLTEKLKNDFPNIGFIFALANNTVNKKYYLELQDRIKKLRIEKNFYFLTDQKELWPLFKKVDLMIRPTYSDGYGVSIAEALYFNCPAIASDVCKRPKGTILFQNRNIEDLYCKCIHILKSKDSSHSNTNK